MQESSYHTSYVLYIIYEHGIRQFFFILAITSLIWQILSLETFDSCLTTIWRTNKLRDQNIIELFQVVLYPFISVKLVISFKLVNILWFDLARDSLTWMHIFVHLHEYLFWICHRGSHQDLRSCLKLVLSIVYALVVDCNTKIT